MSMLSAMEYPDWMMVTGAVLVAFGFIGFALRQNRNGAVHEASRSRAEGEGEVTSRENAGRPEFPNP
jgi:hypothetical protein